MVLIRIFPRCVYNKKLEIEHHTDEQILICGKNDSAAVLQNLARYKSENYFVEASK